MTQRLSRLGFIDARATDLPVSPRLRSRGVPPALAGREVFCTADVEQASVLVGAFLGRNRLTVDFSEASGFQAALNAVRVRGVTLAHLDFHSAVTLDIPATDDIFTVHIHTFGRSACLIGGANVIATSTSAIVTSPGTHVRQMFDFDSPQLIVRLERESVERQLSRMLGRSITKPIVFDPVLELTSPRAVRWNMAIQLLSAEVMMPDSLVNLGIGLSSIEELLISSLLLSMPSNYSELLAPRVEHDATVTAASDYIEQHLAEPVTLAEVAGAVYLSARTVQKAFKESLGTTPTAFIRERRLEKVHGDLLEALPSDGVTVTASAERWGFNHLGEFSVLYRKRFGESPSQTLREH
ncbi:AraC family transcriptional regulator [Subtercola sp. PAMC28395]|uniref:AraC family transcriptional regulator n=1 Tax=Subtercola sp. PAMC28395 TaxID=2846775 RepID=UPI001C0D3D9B|nr:AraC family transcriptional regulator [Subtercola sp. PAMC28395]QWT23105.1 AraC family transcriptional regulator [Subtercola sp. PAMC28395]